MSYRQTAVPKRTGVGRPPLYRTEDERIEARRAYYRKYYKAHKRSRYLALPWEERAAFWDGLLGRIRQSRQKGATAP